MNGLVMSQIKGEGMTERTMSPRLPEGAPAEVQKGGTGPRRLRKIGWALLGVGLVLPVAAGIVVIKAHQFREMSAAAARLVPPPQPVNVAEVSSRQWQPRIPAVGSVVAVRGTVVSAEADGVVREILFEPGSVAKAGQELVRLDVEVEQAELRAAEAAAEWARVSFLRAKGLLASQSISQAEFDSADSGLRQAEARVDNLRAVIAKRSIRAPFAGRLGIRQISVGQFLTKGSQVVSLQSLDPVYVEFSLPQQELGTLEEGLEVLVTSDADPDQRFEGKVTAINPDIDPATRNVRVQATLENHAGRLRPGMFVSVELVLAHLEKVLLIPATAVLHAPFGDSVFVVEAAQAEPGGQKPLVVQQRFVRLGARRGDFVVAKSGLQAGEKVVSTGPFKLRPGMPVVVDNRLAPQFALAPRPSNN